jgi:hypothetical protein
MDRSLVVRTNEASWGNPASQDCRGRMKEEWVREDRQPRKSSEGLCALNHRWTLHPISLLQVVIHRPYWSLGPLRLP